MALSNTRMGSAIAATIKSFRPNVNGSDKVTDGQLETLWQAISQDIIDEFTDNADINLSASDIPVLPGSFKDGSSLPVSGQGENDAVLLEGKIE